MIWCSSDVDGIFGCESNDPTCIPRTQPAAVPLANREGLNRQPVMNEHESHQLRVA